MQTIKFRQVNLSPALKYTKIFKSEVRIHANYLEFEIKLNCQIQDPENSTEWVDEQVAVDVTVKRDAIGGLEKSLVRDYNMWQILVWYPAESPISLHFDIDDNDSAEKAFKSLKEFYLKP
jgi:hypothetical protein